MSRRTIAWSLVAASTLGACGKDDPSGPPKAGPPSPPPATGMSDAKAGGYGYGYASGFGKDVDAAVNASIQKGRAFLTSKRDEATGGWGLKGPDSGVTSLAASALIATTPPEAVAKDPYIEKALDFVQSKQRADGAIVTNEQYVNYETSAAIAAFAAARVQKYRDAQTKARDFLAKSQIAGDEKDASFGGFPYKSKNAPDQPVDLSNAQFAALALHDADLPADSEVWARLRTYLARVQNRSETNTYVGQTADGKEIVSGNDGGGVYAPGVSKVGLVARPDGKQEAKSYGSMTYALLKCLLFAGVRPDDPRVQAAVAWLAKNFTVDRNPGFEALPDAAKMGQQGYYYYTLTMARALADYEKATKKALEVTDAEGRKHAWRKELAEKVVSLQQADGSWVNKVAERWDEGSPVLATSYALQALAICQGRRP